MPNELQRIQKSFEKGFYRDLHWARNYYYSYKLVSLNSSELLSGASNLQKDMLIYTKRTSQELCVLSLARIYESQDPNYPNRCVSRLSNELRQVEVAESIEIDYPDATEDVRQIIQGNKRHMPVTNLVELTKLIGKALNQKEIKIKIKQLLFIRNKYVAHNEDSIDTSQYKDFWVNYEKLLVFALYIQKALEQNAFGSFYEPHGEVNLNPFDSRIRAKNHWLWALIETIFDKKRIKDPLEHSLLQ